jgi:hypothetical protein
MPLYLFPSQRPELKHLPGLEWEEIVEAASSACRSPCNDYWLDESGRVVSP